MSGIDPDPQWDWDRTATCEVPFLQLATYLPYPAPSWTLAESRQSLVVLAIRRYDSAFLLSLNPVHTGVGPLNLPGLSDTPPVHTLARLQIRHLLPG